jgi:hypothetical protein
MILHPLLIQNLRLNPPFKIPFILQILSSCLKFTPKPTIERLLAPIQNPPFKIQNPPQYYQTTDISIFPSSIANEPAIDRQTFT